MQLRSQEFKPMEYLCDQERAIANLYYYRDTTPLSLPLMPKLRHFDRSFMIENQSYCFNNKKNLEFTEILTFEGICYRFNFDYRIFNKETWVSQFPQKFSKNVTKFFSVSSDFSKVKKFVGRCRSDKVILQSHTLNIELQTYRKDYCKHIFGSIDVRNHIEFAFEPKQHVDASLSTSIIVRPVITSTDESLRKFSPQQ